MLADTALSLPDDPFSGVVSPQLLATTGVAPLSVISTGPDIISHYYNCIVKAQKEVILLTNYWQHGENVNRISDALRELNRRTAARGGSVVIKIMWDRGPRTPADLFRKRQIVPPGKWHGQGLPAPDELSHVTLEVLNYHEPPLGTFHAKLLLVDRRIALVNSNNIQDRPNLEACVHLEGNIVNAVYEVALLSWGRAPNPPLPCIDSPAPRDPRGAFRHLESENKSEHAAESRAQLDEGMRASEEPVKMHFSDIVEQMMVARAGATDTTGLRHVAEMWRRAAGRAGARNVDLKRLSEADANVHAARRLSNISSALDFANNSRVQGELRPEVIEKSRGGWDAQRIMGLLDFEPYIEHEPHAPVPMALVNRRPCGRPGHHDIRNPQAAAWLAAFRYAKQHVFIQSPTLNAAPIRAAVLAAVRRGVRVTLWIDLGFNDKSESLPFQGGTNEQVVSHLYRTLRHDGKGTEKLLEVFWYTGKDMDRPLNAVRKQRNCHVKFCAVDGQVAIIGSGNQDTQSWFHSQEINVMMDSKKVVSEWVAALRRNQSTHIYGRVDLDGVWRGKHGNQLTDTGRDA